MATPPEVVEIINPSDPIGYTKRVLHRNCSEGKDSCLVVKKIVDGWVYKCFRCGAKGGIKSDGMSPKETLKLIMPREIKVAPQSDAIPLDTIPMKKREAEIPLSAYHWLMLYRIGLPQIETYSIGYSPGYKRTIFTIFSTKLFTYGTDHTHIVGWAGRKSRREQMPKWLLRKTKTEERLLFSIVGDDNTHVIVEDPVSAIRIYEATGYSTIALLGTEFLSTQDLIKIKKSLVYIWLDADAVDKATRYLNKCKSLNINSKLIHTQLDPKEYGDSSIHERI